MKKRKYRYLFIIASILILFFTSCSVKTVNDQHLVAALENGVTTLDPGFLSRLNDQYIACNLWEGLVRKNTNNIIEPGMAENWQISKDGLKYVFHLRKNAKWSDGKPVTSDQFEYAWKRALDPKVESAVAFMMYFLKNGEAYHENKAKISDVGVKALNKSTLEVTLEKPTPFFLEVLNYHTYYPLRPDIIKKNPDSWFEETHMLVSNGPFHVEKLDENKEINIVKNPYYWDANNVKLDSVSFQIGKTEEGDAIWKKYTNNEIDFGYAFPEDKNFDLANEIATKKNNVISQNSLATFYLCFNQNKTPFNNIKVRQAFEMALNRKGYVEYRKKSEKVATGFVPSGIPDAKPGSDFRKIGGEFFNISYSEDNLIQAKKLLSENGYHNIKDFPAITILVNSQCDIEYIKNEWEKNLGVNIEVDLCQGRLFNQKREDGNYDILLNNWIADVADPVNFLGFLAEEKSSKNVFPSGYYSLVKESYSISDNSTRMTVLHKAEKVLMESYTLIPLFFRNDVYYIKPNIKNYLKTPLAEIYFRNAYIEN